MTGRGELARTRTVTEVRRGPTLQGPCMEKNNKASGRRVRGQRGRKHGLKKKRAKETERTFCDCNSERW